MDNYADALKTYEAHPQEILAGVLEECAAAVPPPIVKFNARRRAAAASTRTDRHRESHTLRQTAAVRRIESSGNPPAASVALR
jgi:hypothetical protein